MPSEFGQVEVADPEDVDPVDGRDRVDVLDAPCRLDLGDEQHLVVGGFHLLDDVAAGVVVVGDAEGRPAAPTGGYLAESTITCACSAVSTIGTISPIAPTSRGRAMR